MVSIGGQGSGSHQSNRSQSRTTFPGQFLEDFGGTFGRGVSLEELLAGLPRSSSLFGGNTVGILPTGNRAPQQDLPYTPVTSTPQLYWQTQRKNMAAGNGLDQLARARQAQQAEQYAATGNAGNPGAFPGVQVAGAAKGTIANGVNSPLAQDFQGPGFIDPNAPIGPRFAASGSSLGGLDVTGGIQRLGFGQTPEDYRQGAPTIRDLPSITAPVAQAAQMNLAGGDLSRLEDSLFHSNYDPQARELARTGAVNDRQLQAQLAGAGLASSGAGVGQLAQQVRDREAQRQGIASDAAYQAAAQRYGYQFNQEEQNAQLRQQTALANAGFNMDAQKQNAQNILAGDTARSDAYLKTIGLNEQAAQAGRQQFLDLLGLGEQDLQRMDNFQQQTLGLLLNNWLQQLGAVGTIGRENESSGKGNSASGGGGLSVASSGGGGGGGGGKS